MNKIMSAKIVLVIFLMLLAGASAVQAGTILLIEQERYVQADIVWGDPDIPGGGEDHAEDFASDYGLFDSTVSVSKLWYDLLLWASAGQLSEIVGPSVTASGSAESGGHWGPWEYAMSVSSFSLTFELAEAQEFSIAGSLSADRPESNAGILFTGPVGTILDESVRHIHWQDPPKYAEFSISGTLNPGLYTLSAWSTASPYIAEEPTASFTFEAVIPEPSTVVLLALGMGYFIAANKGRNKRSG